MDRGPLGCFFDFMIKLIKEHKTAFIAGIFALLVPIIAFLLPRIFPKKEAPSSVNVIGDVEASENSSVDVIQGNKNK